jgi:hypothetical protein
MVGLTAEVSAVLIQTLRGCVGLGVLLAMGVSALWAREVLVARHFVTVSVYDDAGVGWETVARAEEAASSVFRRAGVEVNWLNCGVQEELTHVSDSCGKAVFPTNLQLRIVRRSRDLRPGTVGVSYQSAEGIGCYSEIFVEPMEALHRAFQVSVATVLGHAAAHEIAHLLLGTNSHSVRGIMRARWQREDLVNADKGALLFNRAEGETMREHVAAGVWRKAEAALATTPLDVSGAN